MENNQEEKKSNKKTLLILLALLLISNITFIGLWIQEKGKTTQIFVEKEQVTADRENVKTELLQLQEEYASLQTNDQAVQKELEEKRAQIAELLEQAEKHKNDAYIISKLKKETESLRKIMKHFVVEIDSLNTLNKTITEEKEKVKADLSTEKGRTSQLAKEKEDLQKTVSIGSILKAENPTAKGVKFKSGGSKEVETTKASRVEKIKVSFVLGENKIAKSGTKSVYVRIVTPDGKELTKSAEDGNMIKFNGSRGYYAAKQDVVYGNDDAAVDVFCASPSPFVPGKYLIDIICEEAVIGQTSITLK
jgi:cell division protein FtsL